jgi:hypothetical protein
MTPKQLIDFDARREAVLRSHLKQDPKYKKRRRRGRFALVTGALRYVTAVGLLLFLVKTFLISQYGPDAYLEMLDPVISQVPADSIFGKAVLPGEVSGLLATAFSDLLVQNTEAVAVAVDAMQPGNTQQAGF